MLTTCRYGSCVALLGALLLVASSLAVAAEGDEVDRTPKDCVSLPRVARTEIIDDQTILFYERGGKVYLNHLPRKCGNLAREDRFMYKTTTTRLCSSDTITVLEHWGAGFSPGFTCRLGKFNFVTAEEIADLKAAQGQEGGRRRAIKAEAVELPPAKEAAEDADAAPPAPTPPAESEPH
jgi:hypothetical protein